MVLEGFRRLRGVVTAALVVGLAVGVGGAHAQSAGTSVPIYLDTHHSFAERAADLVSRMTLPEKASQLPTTNAQPIPRLGVQSYAWWNEGLHGIYFLFDNTNCAPPCTPGPTGGSGIHATSFPTNFASTMSWDPPLVYQETTAISDEARGFLDKSLWGSGQNNLGPSKDDYGSLTYFSPTMNMDRDPRWGRTDEAFGEDPYLASRMGDAYVDGYQGQTLGGAPLSPYVKVVPTAKHYALNNVEEDRMGISSNTTDANIRDYYTAQFRHVIEDAHVAGLMTSYNAINGTPATVDTYTANELAQRTYGFAGYSTSDCLAIGTVYSPDPLGHDWAPPGWTNVSAAGGSAAWVNPATAQHVSGPSGAEAFGLRAGTDVNCLGPEANAANVEEAISSGVLSEGVLDNALVRMFTVRMATGEFDPPGNAPYTKITKDVIESPAHQALARTLADNSLVLLKDESAVPLAPAYTVTCTDARSFVFHLHARGSAVVRAVVFVNGRHVMTVRGRHLRGLVVRRLPPGTFRVRIVTTTRKGVRAQSTRTYTGCHKGRPTTKVVRKRQARRAHQAQSLSSSAAPLSAPLLPADPANLSQVVVLGDLAGKVTLGGYSGSPTLQVSPVQGITAAVKAANPRASVTFDACNTSSTSTSAAQCSAATQAAVKAADLVVVFAGTDSNVAGEGNDRADLAMPGNYDSLIKQVAALGNRRMVLAIQSDGPVKIDDVQGDFRAIVFSGYNGESQGDALADVLFGRQDPSGRLDFTWYKDDAQVPDKHNYGLTPSQTGGLGRTHLYFTGTPTYPFGFGLSYTRFAVSHVSVTPRSVSADGVVNVAFDVTNAGRFAGAAVPQLYVAPTFTVPGVELTRNRLVGFQKTEVLKPGQTQHIALSVNASDLSRWDEQTLRQAVDDGTYRFEVAASSSDVLGSGTATVSGSITPHVQHVTVQPDQVVFQPGQTLDLTGKNPWIAPDTNSTLEQAHAPADNIVEAVNDDQSFVDLKAAGVTYSSSNDQVAAVSSAGVLRAVGPGVATINATVGGVTGSTVIDVQPVTGP